MCAAKSAKNESILFHIKANEKDTGLYYSADNEGIPKQVSPIDMAETIQCELDEPNALPLPEGWEATQERVFITFNEYMINAGLVMSSHLSPQINKALKILVGIIKKEKSLPIEVKNKLITARGLISQGNETLARQIIKLDASLQKSLFESDKLPFIIQYVEQHLKNIQNKTVQNNSFEPFTVISVALKTNN